MKRWLFVLGKRVLHDNITEILFSCL